MRKEAVVICLVVISLILLLFSVLAIENGESEKTTTDVREALVENEKVLVVIETQETSGFFGIKKDGVKEAEKALDGEMLGNSGNLVVANISEEELRNLEESKSVKRIEFSPQFKAMLQDSIGVVNASSVWPVQVSSKNITGIDTTICVIDSGADFSNPSLLGKNKTCVIDCFNKACVENCSISDDSGHGTHVAGIAAASSGINGVAPGANLIALKVLDSTGASSVQGTVDVKNAIEWCIANRNAYNISVITMSLGTSNLYNTYCDSSFSSTITSAINNASAFNISVIASSGNAGSGISRSTTEIASPACIENATSVSATDKDDAIASYGHYNNLTDFFAPGTNINSTCIAAQSSTGYCLKSGTSMSAPHVAAAFSLIKQFYLLETGIVYKPREIENALKNHGKNIGTPEGYNITRIDVYNTIISLDNAAPNVTLISPSNNLLNPAGNYTFRCNASDISLKNATFYLWNASSAVVNSTSGSVSGFSNNYETNVTGISSGSYKWNCYYSDSNNNVGFASSNYTLSVGGVSVSLLSPGEGRNTNTAQNNFSCESISEQSYSLKNVTFYLWNSSAVVNTQNEDTGGFDNITTFNYTFSLEGNYKWNCLSYNNNSNSAFAAANYSMIYDITKPSVAIESPIDGYSASGAATIAFQFNVSDNFGFGSCNLILNGALSDGNGSALGNGTNTISKSIDAGSYSWGINCSDLAGNVGNSSTRSFSLTASPASTQSSSGGGGSSPVGGGTGNVVLQKQGGSSKANVSSQNVSEGIQTNQVSGSFNDNFTTTENKNQRGISALTGAVISGLGKGSWGVVAIATILIFIFVVFVFWRYHKRINKTLYP